VLSFLLFPSFTMLRLLVWSAIMLVLLDIPVARLHYWFRVHYALTPIKEEQLTWLSQLGAHCRMTAVDATAAYPNCTDLCRRAFDALALRREILNDVRSYHPIGAGPAAVIFDMDQGRVIPPRTLLDLQSQPCQQILERCDYLSNEVNWLAFQALLAGITFICWKLAGSPTSTHHKVR